jgi:hypothetical protein
MGGRRSGFRDLALHPAAQGEETDSQSLNRR